MGCGARVRGGAELIPTCVMKFADGAVDPRHPTSRAPSAWARPIEGLKRRRADAVMEVGTAVSDVFESNPQFKRLSDLVRERLPAEDQAEAIETLREFFRLVSRSSDAQREQIIAYVKTILLPARRAD